MAGQVMEAIRTTNVHHLNNLLALDASLGSWVSAAGTTPLLVAAACDDEGTDSPACIRSLLSFGVDVNFVDRAGVTAAMTAARCGRPHNLAAVLTGGADLAIMTTKIQGVHPKFSNALSMAIIQCGREPSDEMYACICALVEAGAQLPSGEGGPRGAKAGVKKVMRKVNKYLAEMKDELLEYCESNDRKATAAWVATPEAVAASSPAAPLVEAYTDAAGWLATADPAGSTEAPLESQFVKLYMPRMASQALTTLDVIKDTTAEEFLAAIMPLGGHRPALRKAHMALSPMPPAVSGASDAAMAAIAAQFQLLNSKLDSAEGRWEEVQSSMADMCGGVQAQIVELATKVEEVGDATSDAISELVDDVASATEAIAECTAEGSDGSPENMARMMAMMEVMTAKMAKLEEAKSAAEEESKDSEALATIMEQMSAMQSTMCELSTKMTDVDAMVRFNTKSLASAQILLAVTICRADDPDKPIWLEKGASDDKPSFRLRSNTVYHLHIAFLRKTDHEAVGGPGKDRIEEVVGQFTGSKKKLLPPRRVTHYTAYLTDVDMTVGSETECRAVLKLPPEVDNIKFNGALTVTHQFLDKDGLSKWTYEIPINIYGKKSPVAFFKDNVDRAKHFWDDKVPDWAKDLIISGATMLLGI
eukprot:PLAT5525.1.p1 GENE.PLAT5525.1~~PLAT5525.1.p1  ORF type:complete len:691 (-),score=304.52 PLAT5525.1:217-2154(-)